MFAGIPIIGIAGGIGSGKSYIASLFGKLGCLVIDSDAQVREAYQDPAVQSQLLQWWGPQVVGADGKVDRAAVAAKVFSDPSGRRQLENLLYPIVARARDEVMARASKGAESGAGPKPLAFIWDTPLLFEAGLRDACDVVVFVDAPEETRVARVTRSRGWTPEELARREMLQWPLDKKRQLSDDVIVNAAESHEVEHQVQQTFSRILGRLARLTGL